VPPPAQPDLYEAEAYRLWLKQREGSEPDAAPGMKQTDLL
jgi:hypothetical protein